MHVAVGSQTCLANALRCMVQHGRAMMVECDLLAFDCWILDLLCNELGLKLRNRAIFADIDDPSKLFVFLLALPTTQIVFDFR